MAFTYELVKRMSTDSVRMAVYKFVSASGSTGGVVNTEFRQILGASVTAIGTAVVANASVVNAVGSDVTVTTDANVSGYLLLIGI